VRLRCQRVINANATVLNRRASKLLASLRCVFNGIVINEGKPFRTARLAIEDEIDALNAAKFLEYALKHFLRGRLRQVEATKHMRRRGLIATIAHGSPSWGRSSWGRTTAR